jgi:hypothetical protein
MSCLPDTVHACRLSQPDPSSARRSWLAIGLNQLCGGGWAPGGWGTPQYAQYLSLGHDWAKEWKTNPDVIERVLFSVGKVSKTYPLVISIFTGLPLDR